MSMHWRRGNPRCDSGNSIRVCWLPVPITPQVWVRGHRVDLVIGDRFVIQIDGGHHVGVQRLAAPRTSA